jgi:hypothetical protein
MKKMFNTSDKNEDVVRRTIRNFIFFINNYSGKFMDFNVKYIKIWSDFYRQDLVSMLKSIQNKSIDFWGERIFHQISHRVYQELYMLNINYLNRKLLNNSNNDLLNDKINQIMINLDINYSKYETLNEKLDKIIICTNLLNKF